MLKISAELSLPLDAVTQTFAALAVRGAGKTYLAGKMVEEMARNHLPYCVVDPTGAWYGIRAAADGKGPGLSVIIMGGDHGDVPLAPESGEVVADFVVEERLPVVLDLSLMRKGEAVRFMTAFAETLYRKNRQPLMLVIDEADAYAPQKPMPDQTRLLGAIEDIVRRGRVRGLGVFMLTQRAAVLNKNVLTQIETLIILRTTSPQDRAAIDSWVASNDGAQKKVDDVLDSLSSLPNGTAWFWSPQWLGLFKKVKIGTRWTFNSSATPKLGEARVEPRKMAPVDLAALQAKIGATIEKAKLNDPKVLWNEISRLKLELAEAKAPRPVAPAARVEVPILKEAQIKRMEIALEKGRKVQEISLEAMLAVAKLLESVRRAPPPYIPDPHRMPLIVSDPKMPRDRAEMRSAAAGGPSAVLVNIGISAPQQRILNSLAALKSWGINFPDRRQAALFAEQSPSSSGYANNLSALKTAGLISYPSGGALALTSAGEKSADPSSVGSQNSMRDSFLGRLSSPQSRILRVLIRAHPSELPKEELAALSDQSPASSGYANNLSALRSLGVIEYMPGRTIRASDILFIRGA